MLSNIVYGMLIMWYILTVGSLLFLIWDFATNTPSSKVMKLAWILVTLYTGPIGLVLYFLSCRQPLPNTHDQFISPHWKQAVGSLLHCVAGDATGIIISSIVVYHFRLPNGIDLAIEYISAFIVGLFIFQALFMLVMYNNDYFLAVRKTFFAETVSMNMVMVGMIPAMVILIHFLPNANDPKRLLFWGVMSIATILGMITAYPINSWMVRKGLKHGMMSAIPESHDKEKMDMPMSMNDNKKYNHEVQTLSKFQVAKVLIGTFTILLLVLLITNLFAPIAFS